MLEPAAPSSAAPETNPPVIAPAAEVAAGSVIRDDTVRVAVSKLDTLLNEVGELQAARLGTEQRLAELTEVLQEIEVWENDWRKQRSQIMAAVRRCLHEEGEAQQITTQAATRVNAYLERQEAHLHRTASGLRDVRRRLQADNRRMTQVVDSLEEDVRRTRMLPQRRLTLPMLRYRPTETQCSMHLVLLIQKKEKSGGLPSRKHRAQWVERMPARMR